MLIWKCGVLWNLFQNSLGSTDCLPTLGPHLIDLADIFGIDTEVSIDKGSILFISNITTFGKYGLSSVVEVVSRMLLQCRISLRAKRIIILRKNVKLWNRQKSLLPIVMISPKRAAKHHNCCLLLSCQKKRGKNVMKRGLRVEIRTGKSNTNYHHRQDRLNLGRLI